MDKIRTTVYLDESAANTIKRQKINLSKFVNDQIYSTFGEQHSLTVIRRRIKQLDKERTAMEVMAKDLKHEHDALNEFAARCCDKMHEMPETFKSPSVCMVIWELVIKDNQILCTIPKETIKKAIEHEWSKRT